MVTPSLMDDFSPWTPDQYLNTSLDPTMDTPLFDYLDLDDSQMLTGPDIYLLFSQSLRNGKICECMPLNPRPILILIPLLLTGNPPTFHLPSPRPQPLVVKSPRLVSERVLKMEPFDLSVLRPSHHFLRYMYACARTYIEEWNRSLEIPFHPSLVRLGRNLTT